MALDIATRAREGAPVTAPAPAQAPAKDIQLPVADPVVRRAADYLQTVVDHLADKTFTREQARAVQKQLYENLHTLIRREGGQIPDLTGDRLKDYDTIRAFFQDKGYIFGTFEEQQRNGSGVKQLVELFELKKEKIAVDPRVSEVPGVDPQKLTEKQRAQIEVYVAGRTIVASEPSWYKPLGQTITLSVPGRESIAVLRPDNIDKLVEAARQSGLVPADRLGEYAENLRKIALSNEAGHAAFRQITGASRDKISNATEVGTHNGHKINVLAVSEAFSDYFSLLGMKGDPNQLADFLQATAPFAPQRLGQYKFSRQVMADAMLQAASNDQRLPANPADPKYNQAFVALCRSDPAFAERMRSAAVTAYREALEAPMQAVSDLVK